MINHLYKTTDINFIIRIWISRISLAILFCFVTMHLKENWAGVLIIMLILLSIEYFLQEHQIVLYEDYLSVNKKYFFNLIVKKELFYYKDLDDFITAKEDVFDEVKSNISGAYRTVIINKRDGEVCKLKLLICLSELNTARKIVIKKIAKYN